MANKGLNYGELIVDNIIGLDNEYESLGEKIGKQFNQDEAAFLKKMGVGMYEGAKDFISAPIETTKEGFKEFATGTTNFLFKDLDTRLQEMFKTDYNNATPEQVTKARESVLGDAVIASGILPAGKVIGNVVEGAVDIGTNAARKIDLSKVNSAMARANKIAEDLEGKVDQSILGEGYRLAAKERMGKGRGKQNSAQTAAALNLGYTEIGFHSTGKYDLDKEIEVFKLPDEIYAKKAAAKGITLKEAVQQYGGFDSFDNPDMAHDFLGVHVGTTKAAADRAFNKSRTEDTEGARTYQLRLKTNKPFLDGKKPWTEKGLNKFLVKEMDKIKSGQVFEKMQIVRRRLAEQGYTHVPYINNVEDKRNISYAMLVDRPEGGGVNSSAVIRYKDAEFNPLEKFNRNAKFAQGGVAMRDQMEMNFALGGTAETVDPVSGNDVPPGSLPVEVRDDIPARLSEGEYVVPADVVRYFGVRVFEEMRMEAKMGLQKMDADGRIGGEPMEPQVQQAELSEEELNSIIEQAMQEQQPIMANEGTLVDSTSGAYKPPEVIQRFGLGLGSSLFDPNFGKNEFYPDMSDYKPSTGDYDTAETIQDQAASTKPECGINPMTGNQQVYNEALGRCVDRKTGDDEGPPPGGTTTTTSSTSWGEDKEGNQVDFGDPEALEKYIDSLNTPVDLPGTETLRDSAALAGKFIHPVAGLAIGAASLYGKVDATTDIAGLRAGRITAAIYGHDKLVKDIEEKIAGYTGGTGFTRGGKFGDTIKTNDAVGGLFGTGFGFASKAHGSTNKEIKAFMEMVDNPNTDPEKLKEVREKLKEKSIAHRKAQRELAKISSDKEKTRREAARRVAAATAAAASRQQILNANAAELARRKKQMEDSSDDYFDSGSSYKGEKTVSGAIQKMKDEGDFNVGGRATGGLVQKRKKKK